MAPVPHSRILTAIEGGVQLRLRVQPGARAERLEGVQDDELRLRLTAPPIDGTANTACVAFLARTLGVRRSQITLQSGSKSRHKVLLIDGVSLQHAAATLGVYHSTP